MNKVANVVYAYDPKNEDELKLNVGDKIQVIGEDEEGWWRGILKGKEGVFPSNFVQIIEANQLAPDSNSQPSKPSSLIAAQQNKLGSLFASKSSNKTTSLSTNSLNSNHSNNSNTTTTNNNNNMNSNTRDTTAGLPYPADGMPPSAAVNNPANQLAEDGSGERRPKPIRGVGFGDIFAANAATGGPKIRLPGGMNATERSSTMPPNSLSKLIPKKPPPPTPTSNNDTNGSSAAPALPPKPSNQFSPHGGSLQNTRMLPPNPYFHTATSPQSQSMMSSLQQVLPSNAKGERARVIYAYDAQNGDELTLEVDDIINVLDKEIEDAGWWKGELRGKIGVFPDNFVQLIEDPELPAKPETSDSNWITSNRNSSTSLQGGQPPVPAEGFIGAGIASGKLKSVFNTTPKGFNKELENNLEKQQQHNSNSAVSFLSLKRNKLQQSGAAVNSEPSEEEVSAKFGSGGGGGSNADMAASGEAQSPTKLNHMTVNRAKGPTRRPPSNFLNKKSSLDQSSPPSLPSKTNGRSDTGSLLNPPTFNNHDTPPLSSLPPTPPTASATPAMGMSSGLPLSARTGDSTSSGPMKASLSLENVIDEPVASKTHNNNITSATNSNHNVTPKTTQRASQSVMGSASIAAAASAGQDKDATKTPAWMVELRNKKAATENKREAPSLVTPTLDNSKRIERDISPAKLSGYEVASSSGLETSSVAGAATGQNGTIPVTNQFMNQLNNNTPAATSVTTQTNSGGLNSSATNNADVGQLAKQISKDVTGELSELRDEVRRLRDDMREMNELRDAVNSMKIELKACQSATENQKRYIKDLVNNLADERKKIAAMQTELERNLK